LKAASWLLTLLFILAFAGALSLLPAPGDITAPLSVHVSARYEAQSAVETGWALPLAAVLGDYRSFDLLLFSLLAMGAWLLRWGAAQSTNVQLTGIQGVGLLICAVGSLALLIIGAFSILKGCRFLDYECWALFTTPEKARVLGAAWARGLASIAVLLFLVIHSKGKP
jgi:hypothetical protein